MNGAGTVNVPLSDAEERQVFAVSVAARNGRGHERLRIKAIFLRRKKKSFDDGLVDASVAHDPVFVQVLASRFELRLDKADEHAAASHREKDGGIDESL